MKKKIKLFLILSLTALCAMFSIGTAFALQPEIPSDTSGYTISNTVEYGGFEEFAENKQMATADASTMFWGSVTLDHPGVVVTHDSTKTLRLKKSALADKANYASAFVLYDQTRIRPDEWMTVEFEYKLDAADPEVYLGKAVTMTFIGAQPSLGEHHRILLDGSEPALTEGDNSYKWPVTFAAGSNGAGWKKVTTVVYTNSATMMTNSIRWLFPVISGCENDALYIDNVKILRWQDNTVPDYTPVIVGASSFNFDKKKANDVTVVVNPKGQNISSVKRGTTNLNSSAYTKTANGDNVSIVLSKDYIKTLDAGTHSFSINTIEGSVSFQITISNGSGGCGATKTSSGEMFTGGLIIFAGAGMIMLIKNNKGKRAVNA